MPIPLAPVVIRTFLGNWISIEGFKVRRFSVFFGCLDIFVFPVNDCCSVKSSRVSFTHGHVCVDRDLTVVSFKVKLGVFSGLCMAQKCGAIGGAYGAG